jgi:hypothetical protein
MDPASERRLRRLFRSYVPMAIAILLVGMVVGLAQDDRADQVAICASALAVSVFFIAVSRWSLRRFLPRIVGQQREHSLSQDALSAATHKMSTDARHFSLALLMISVTGFVAGLVMGGSFGAIVVSAVGIGALMLSVFFAWMSRRVRSGAGRTSGPPDSPDT